MKKSFAILLSFFFVITPLTVFAQTETTTVERTTTETTTDDNTTVDKDTDTVTSTEITTTESATSTESEPENTETIGITNNTDQETTTTTTSKTSEKSITDYLPYILLAGAFILLISIIAIIFSGKEDSKKEEEDKKEDLKPQTNPLDNPPTNMDNISDSLYTPQTQNSETVEQTETSPLVQKPTEKNIASDLQSLVNQEQMKNENNPTTTEPSPTPENIVDETPEIEQTNPVNQTLDQPLENNNVFNSQPVINTENTVPEAIPTTTEDQFQTNTPLTETPSQDNSIYTPTLNTVATTEEQPQTDTQVIDNNTPVQEPPIESNNMYYNPPVTNEAQPTEAPIQTENNLNTMPTIDSAPLQQPTVNDTPMTTPEQPLINTNPAPQTTSTVPVQDTQPEDTGLPPVPPLM